MINAYNGFVKQFGPDAQANALQGMNQDVMDAYAQENQSRVVQEREEKQRQHEKEMERMRLDALLNRLGQQGGSGNYTESGPHHSTTWHDNGSWVHRVG